MHSGSRARVATLGACLLIGAAPLIAPVAVRSSEAVQTPLDLAESTGAAPGYVDDGACASCHVDIVRSYREVAMSKSFYRPGSQPAIERLEPFFDAASKTWMSITETDGAYEFESYQLDADGERINEYRRRIDWILGSGNHARTYLIQTPGGELFQLPLAWYTQIPGWGMAPGFVVTELGGVHRTVHRECMFCHNAYPEVPAGADLTWRPDTFPGALPEGVGCQRCHGPGAEHVRAARAGGLEGGSRIVDPADLDATRRNDVCYQCHMQPAAAFIGVRRFGRPIYSFRPGQDLTEYVALFDVTEEEGAERFEINHHPYRLEQSRCFTESQGELSCLTCHDPHVKVPPAERAAHYRSRCLGCHEPPAGPAHEALESSDCTACHMPERRTQDVVRVTMTDHTIRRRPGGDELLARLEERGAPTLTDVFPLYPEREPSSAEVAMYRAVTALRVAHGPQSILDSLERQLRESDSVEVQPWIDLAGNQLRRGQLAKLEETVAAIQAREPGHPLALEFQAIAHDARGDRERAIELQARAARANPERPEVHYNLGVLHLRAGRIEDAEAALLRAVALRPSFTLAWYYLSKVHRARGELAAAADALRRGLAIDSGGARGYVELAEVLIELGQPAEALRYLRHGATVARQAEVVRAALEKATAGGGGSDGG